jgi:hypothetical protein
MSKYASNCIVGPEWAMETTLIRKTSQVVQEYDDEKAKAALANQQRMQAKNINAMTPKKGFFGTFIEAVTSSIGEGLFEESAETLAKQEAQHAAASREIRANTIQKEALEVCSDHDRFVEFKQKLKDSKTTGITPEVCMRQLAAKRIVSMNHSSTASECSGAIQDGLKDRKTKPHTAVTPEAYMRQVDAKRTVLMNHSSKSTNWGAIQEASLSRQAQRKASIP